MNILVIPMNIMVAMIASVIVMALTEGPPPLQISLTTIQYLSLYRYNKYSILQSNIYIYIIHIYIYVYSNGNN